MNHPKRGHPRTVEDVLEQEDIGTDGSVWGIRSANSTHCRLVERYMPVGWLV